MLNFDFNNNYTNILNIKCGLNMWIKNITKISLISNTMVHVIQYFTNMF